MGFVAATDILQFSFATLLPLFLLFAVDKQRPLPVWWDKAEKMQLTLAGVQQFLLYVKTSHVAPYI